jgi:hypothetical protein
VGRGWGENQRHKNHCLMFYGGKSIGPSNYSSSSPHSLPILRRFSMPVTWISTKFKGVRYYEHPERKHGVKKDRYLAIRYQKDGQRKEEGLGCVHCRFKLHVYSVLYAQPTIPAHQPKRVWDGERSAQCKRTH